MADFLIYLTRNTDHVFCNTVENNITLHTGPSWRRHQIGTFSVLLVLCAENSPHKGQWCGALIFSLIYAWTNGWVYNRDAGDWRRHLAHYDDTVMMMKIPLKPRPDFELHAVELLGFYWEKIDLIITKLDNTATDLKRGREVIMSSSSAYTLTPAVPLSWPLGICHIHRLERKHAESFGWWPQRFVTGITNNIMMQ